MQKQYLAMNIKTSLILLLAFILVGCDVNTQDAKVEHDKDTIGGVSAICLDGIQYWNNSGQLAVRIDPKTLEPKRCVK